MSDQDERAGGRTRFLSRFLQLYPVAKIRYNVQFVSGVIRTVGFREGIAFLNQLDGVVHELGAYYGPMLGNIVLCVAGSFNGCRFCGVGHLYGANVEYFLTTGKLFPLDELDILKLHTLPFDEFRQVVQQRLADSEFAEERRVLDRTFALRMGQTVETDEDRVLMRVLDVWYALGECTIGFSYDAEAVEVPPFLLKKTPMKDIRRYRIARGAQRSHASS